jgi:hypothetical protein
MNKNEWGYKYNFNTIEDNKDLPGIKLKLVNSINITTNLGKDYADQQAKNYVENYDYPGRIVDIYYSLTNNRYIPGINYVGKTKESVGK